MKKLVASTRFLCEIRSLKSHRNRQTARWACRKLVIESMERRVLLASDLFLHSPDHNSCPAIEPAVEHLSQVNHQTTVELSSLRSLQEVPEPEELLISMSSAALPTSVVGGYAFYNGSPFAVGEINGAIDFGKVVVNEGPEPIQTSMNNVLSNSQGITGLSLVFSNLYSTELSVADFQIQVSPLGLFDPIMNPPSEWEAGANPLSVEVSEPDLAQDRIVALRWEAGAIENRWLRVTVLANENTGLVEPSVYYLGHLNGKVHDSENRAFGDLGRLAYLEVTDEDLKSVRMQVGNVALPSNRWDINKDGVVSFRDIYEVRMSHGNQLPLISIPSAMVPKLAMTMDVPSQEASFQSEVLSETASEVGGQEPSDPENPVVLHAESPATVVGAFVYHRNSDLAALDKSGALDTTKQLALETDQPQTLSIQNLINSNRGINGIVFDLLNMPAETLSVGDFVFQVSPTGAFHEVNSPAVNWESAPTPEEILVNKDMRSGVSRVNIHWADNALTNRWLRITLLANSNTGLSVPLVYYVGHLQGKNTDWMIHFNGLNPSGVYEVHTVDILAIREQVGQVVGAGSIHDVNKDGVVSFADISAMRDTVGVQLSNITVVALPAASLEFLIADTTTVLDAEMLSQDVPTETEVVMSVIVEQENVEQKIVEQEDRLEKDLSPPIVLHSDSPASVVGAFVSHRNSGFDGSGLDGALDTAKQLALESSQLTTLSFQNLVNSSRGINGLVFDLLNMPGQELTAADFQFQVSPTGAFEELSNPAFNWELAPSPEEITVSVDQQTGVSRVSIHWADSSIMNRWLRITLLANANTGLTVPVVYYIGHLEGKSTGWLNNFGPSNPNGVYEVDDVDMFTIREQVGQNVGAGSMYDVNKDGVISFADIAAMRESVGMRLSNIAVVSIAATPSATVTSVPSTDDSSTMTAEDFANLDLGISHLPDASQSQVEDFSRDSDADTSVVLQGALPASVVGAFANHRNSGLAGSATDGGLDSAKQLALESDQPQTLSIQNLINSSRGINGLVFDLLNMPGLELTVADFQFQVSPTGAFEELSNPAVNWDLAPAPDEILVSRNKETGVSRVSIHWADNSIMNRWLRITLQANSNTGLTAPVVYYIGHLEGKSTGWLNNFGPSNPNGVYEVGDVDMFTIREQVGQNVGAGSVYDVNKDGVISFADIAAMRDAVGMRLSNIAIVSMQASPSSIVIDEPSTDIASTQTLPPFVVTEIQEFDAEVQSAPQVSDVSLLLHVSELSFEASGTELEEAETTAYKDEVPPFTSVDVVDSTLLMLIEEMEIEVLELA